MASIRIRVLVLLALALGGYKVPRPSAGDDLATGTLSGSDYENRLYGFSFDMFVNDLWKKVEHPGTVFLLGVDRHTDKPLRERIIVLGDRVSGYHPPLASVSDYVSKLAHLQVKVQGRELLRDAYAVDCGRRRCYVPTTRKTITGFGLQELRGHRAQRFPVELDVRGQFAEELGRDGRFTSADIVFTVTRSSR